MFLAIVAIVVVVIGFAVASFVLEVLDGAPLDTVSVVLPGVATLLMSSGEMFGSSELLGVSGASGVSGVSGMSGVSGVFGLSGASGVLGVSGLSGMFGVSGVSGVFGKVGSSSVWYSPATKEYLG